MRKIALLFVAFFVAIGLAACQDKKTSDELINVIFYTGQNATKIETYFDIHVDSKIEAPEEPTRDGFFFDGWYKDIAFTQAWDFDNDVVTQTTILFAKWRSGVWPLTLVLRPELGEEFVTNDLPPTEFTAGKGVYLPDVRRPGGSFRGWSLVPQDEFTLDMKVYKNTQDLPITQYTEFVLYPIFNNNKYLVTYQVRMAGISTPAPKTGVEYGSVINWLPVIADTATHRFIGWFTKNGANTGDWGYQLVNQTFDENGDPIVLPDGVIDYYPNASNTLLYGKWEEK